MKTRTLFTIPVVGLLVLVGVFSNAPSALAECPLPPGVTPPPDPPVTAQQVEDGSATLKEFALAVRDQYRALSREIATFEGEAYFGCLIRQDGSPYRSGSTFLVSLAPDGSVLVHSKAMALSGRSLNPLIYRAIFRALGARGFTDLFAAANSDGGSFNVPDIPGASGYATVYMSPGLRIPVILLAGFDLNESHVVEEEIDYGDPAITARDVVDRETLKAFVTEAGHYFLELAKTGGLNAIWKAKYAMRDPNGPWRHGPVYLYVLDLASNLIMFHGAFPDRYEFRPLIATVRDAVTGELVLPQVLEAAKSGPEGGFVAYYFDDPTDATDSADIPKVGYARVFTGPIREPGERFSQGEFIVGSGFYGRAPEVVPTDPRTEVQATVLGDAVEGLTVAFARSIAGQQPDYAHNAVTDANGSLSLTISSADGVSGYYQARARNADGEIVGQWHSIPLNRNQRQVLELPLGGGMTVVRVGPLAASKPVLAAETVAVSETVPEVSGLAPNFPNPFNSATMITYHLASPGPVQLVIYNVLGQPVRTLVDASQAAGSYQIRWDVLDQRGVSLSTGIYIARLSYPGGVQTQRLLYLK